MAEQADILAGLHDLRMGPPGFADLVTALALGLIAAALVGLLLRAVTARRRQQTMLARVRAAQTLPAAERSLSLLLLLREMTERCAPGPGPWTARAARLCGIAQADLQGACDGLYRPGGAALPEALETAMLRVARRTRD